MKNKKIIISCLTLIVFSVAMLMWVKASSNAASYYPLESYPDNGFSYFYKMKKDSVDVLFLGSSVGVNGFNTQEFYDQYGIRSYNLCSVQQPIPLSYCWLKEAVKYQHPKLVVLDSRFLYQWHPADILNGDAGAYHVALDKMRLSKDKIKSVTELSEIDPTIEPADFLFTVRHKHEIWKNLREKNIYFDAADSFNLKGYAPGDDVADSYDPFVPSNETDRKDFDPIMQSYMDKIVDLCNEKGIKLVLVTMIGNDMNDAMNNSLNEYANNHGIDHINLCNYEHFYAMAPDYPRESVTVHSNLGGSAAIARYFGKILQEQYDVPSVQDDQWEQSKAYYDILKENEALREITDTDEYLQTIANKRYAVFISSRLDANYGMNDSLRADLSGLGLATSWDENMDGQGYMAAITDEGIMEKVGVGITTSGVFRKGKSMFFMKVPTLDYESSCQIQIDRENYSLNRGGLNIVVYDMELNTVVDRVNIASWGDCSLSR